MPFRALAVALLLLVPATAPAVVRTVPGDHATITAALAAADPGDEIVVAEGTWSPSSPGETFPLVVGDGIVLRGAGAGLSVLDAEDTASVVRFAGGSGAVRHFTLTGGRADRGGGVQIEGGSPEVAHNLIVANGALKRGSGINVQGDATPWIHHNVVWMNYDLDLEESGDPHGIQCGVSSAGIVEHNLVGRTDSNGLFVQEQATPIVRHNIFAWNGIEGWRGRGICNFGPPATTIHHNLFFANVKAALVMRDPDGVIVDVTAQQANDLFGDDGLYGNLDGDPLLVDPDGLDFRLTATSPAIDAGDPSLGTDADGTTLDIGPFPFLRASDKVPALDPTRLVGAFPNPFNPQTRVVFRVERTSRVQLRIVDPRGRTVRRLADATFPGGEHAVRWDGTSDAGRDVASGVYLAVLRTGDGRESRPLVLVR